MKIVKRTTIAAAAVAVMSYVGVANAMNVTDTLADLANNPSAIIGIGDKVFSGFSYHASGLTSFDASQITVTASYVGGVYYLTWGGNISLLTSPGSATTTADLLLGYTVTATAGQIYYIDQSYTGSAQNGSLAVDETAKAGNQTLGFSHLQVGDLSDPFAEPGDILSIVPPQTSLTITKDINLGVYAGGGQVSISQVEQSFEQSIPDGGATAMLLGAALTAMGLLRRKLIA
jgi:hypothetical protein